MPNWCYTSVIIDGKKKDVQSLYSKMNNLENRRKPLVENGFGKTWLGCLVNKLGGNWEKVYCRGSWSDLYYEGGTLHFNTETAWGPMTEVFKFIKQTYPSLEIYYSAEEDGMGIFVTNDTEGKHFTERYRIETDCDYEYFTTLDGVCNFVSGIVGKTVKGKEELNTAINDWNENTEDDDKLIYLNEFSVIPNEYL